MRLNHPNDENGGMLFLALPTICTHRIDPWSPLCPPRGFVGGGGGAVMFGRDAIAEARAASLTRSLVARTR